jgi:hypothetical protein
MGCASGLGRRSSFLGNQALIAPGIRLRFGEKLQAQMDGSVRGVQVILPN